MLLMRKLTPSLHVRSDSIQAKLFAWYWWEAKFLTVYLYLNLYFLFRYWRVHHGYIGMCTELRKHLRELQMQVQCRIFAQSRWKNLFRLLKEKRPYLDHVSFRVHRSMHRPRHRSMHRSILDRLSTDMRPTCRSTVDRESTDVLVELPLISADVSTVIISVGYRSTTGGISVNYRPICRPILWYRSTYRPISWVITTAKRLIKSAYSYCINPIDRCIERCLDRCPDRYIDLCLDRYIDRYTRWSIGTLSVKHRWSISERHIDR